MPKRCQKCRILKRYSDFNRNKNTKDGYSAWCRDCKKAHWMDYSERKKKGYAKKNGCYLYFVIYDPCNSFSWNSSFTRNEVDEMLDNEYLAIGTRFKRGKYEYRVNEKMCLKVV